MALKAYTDGYSQEVGVINMFGSWDGNVDEDVVSLFFVWSYVPPGGFGSETSKVFSDAVSGSYSRSPAVDPDRIVQFKAKACIEGCVLGENSGQFKTYAAVPSAADPVVTLITQNSAHVQCTYNAAVVNSTFVVQLYYRQFGDISWTAFGAPKTTGTSIEADLTGLLGGTIYQVKLHGERTTENDPEWESNVVSFTTLVTDPLLIQTDPASSVSETQATLNGTVDPNTIEVRVRFGWGTSDGGGTPGSWTNLTAYQNFSGSGNQHFDASVAVAAATTYFFRAFMEWPSPDFDEGDSGVTLSFTTPSTPPPPPPGGWEDRMHLPQYDGHYGVQTDIYFTLSQPSATSNDRLVTAAPGSIPIVAGDVKIIKDGGASANATNSVTQPNAAQPIYKLVLTATEMQAELVLVQIVDQTATPAFRDLYILVRTKERLGQQLVDASQIGGSAPAVQWKPSTGGYSLDACDSAGTNIGKIRGFLESMALRSGTADGGGASSITLDSGASPTNDYYNGDVVMLVGGTGVGQSRVITDYDGVTKVASVGSSWSTNPVINNTRFVIMPGARTLDTAIPELSGIPAAGGNAGLKLQFCFQRFAFKIDQTATTQQMYKADSTTVLGSRSVADNGTTQTVGKI